MEPNFSTLNVKDAVRSKPLDIRPDTDDAAHEKPVKDRGAILCRVCGRIITHERDRLGVQGAHQHTFANPQGLVFEIGCFQTADGCAHIGELTAEFTWFAGYQWQIALCAGCLTHVGWLCISAADQFHGLILGRLVRGDVG
jgi:hypothetical protein